ncbi:MAG: XRE family transcriptional regulator [Novosphingobium sp. 28-62-57]|uniref:helix-turn-helix domain-containing protein n=1 Tax=unclassified Novosphingobium TaxID=2644732 RepID=UPI000BCBCC92|nr:MULTISPECIES: helix-turn-helix transcriptional regulator [unclassified Novosphingobium]OYW49026.1 MAG: XRE family transcriptional regulator [Novosphingobium sp. 12-62-10]OYZ09506.1 MAG: XRE family transcriptional regulator [Novosphingobium sp. 28-62-57]OZA30499.1 MAG: XRE family transcriptional regulator [Novosphingobium sp. 17-62-9]
MTKQGVDFELIRGSGNVFADLGLPDAELEQLRAILAAEISKTLVAEKLTVRAAEKITGVAAADFSRIRQARLKSFTIDRLMTILDRLNRKMQVSVTVSPRGAAGVGGLHV